MGKFRRHHQLDLLFFIILCFSFGMLACQAPKSISPASPTTQPTATMPPVATKTLTINPTPTCLPPTETPTQVPSPTPIPFLGSGVINESNANQMREIGRLGNGFPKDIAYSPDGEMFGVCSSTGLYLYVSMNWGGPNLLGEETACESMAWSPDSTFLASGNVDGKIRVWNVQTEELVKIMGDGNAAITSVAWSPDGYTLASADYRDSITLWNVENGEPTQLRRGYGDNTNNIVAWSPNSQYLAITLWKDIEVWDINKGETIQNYSSKTPFNSIMWSPDGHSLAAANDGFQILNIHTGEQIFSKELQSEYTWQIEKLSWSPDGTYLAIGDNYGNVEVWDTINWVIKNRYESDGRGDEITGIAWSPFGELITISNSFGIIKHVRTNVSTPDSLINVFSSFQDFAWSPDGSTFASVNANGIMDTWNASTGAKIHSFYNPMHIDECVTWSPDGTKLATGFFGTIFIWDAETGKKIKTMSDEEYHSRTTSIAWSPDGNTIAIAGPYEGKVYLWDFNTGELIRILSDYYPCVSNIAWHPEGQMLASSDGGIWLWDWETGGLINNLAATNMQNNDIAWSPDGRFIAIGGDNNSAKIWDAERGTATYQINGQSSRISSVAWHPIEPILASGSRQGTIYIWNSVTGELLHTLNNLPEDPSSSESKLPTINQLTFSPDGKTLASVSSDGTIRFWGLP